MSTQKHHALTLQTPAIQPNSKPVIDFGQLLPQLTPVTTTLPVLQPDTSLLPEMTSAPLERQRSPVVVPNLDSTSTAGTSTEPTNQLPDILLPAGTQLNLRYVGNSLTLKAGSPQPAELLLQSDLRSLTGELIAPIGTPVIGRFETTGDGSRFIAQGRLLQKSKYSFPALF